MHSHARSRVAGTATAAFALAAATLALAIPGQATAATPTPSARTLTGSHPAWAAASADRGALPATNRLTARVYLAGQDPTGLAAYARAVSTQGNASYGAFLTAAQVQRRFGPSQAQLAAVHAWLTGAGLTVTATTAHWVEVHGDPADLAKAFGTGIHQYSVGGKLQHAPSGNVVLPASVASAVLGVTGLSSVTATAKPQSIPVAATEKTGRGAPAVTISDGINTTATCSDYWGQKQVTGGPTGYTRTTTYDQCSMTPAQLRKAYGITASGLTGKGARVAIVDAYASSTMLVDANRFATAHGDTAFKTGQYTEVVDQAQWNSQDACGGPAGWSGEEALDVEMVHGLAPEANVVYVGANSCQDADLLGALAKVVDGHLADVVSSSWGGLMHTTYGGIDPAEIAAYEQVFEQGAIEGIGFDFSAGDCGDSSPAAAASGVNCDPTTTRAQANWPDSDPWATSVGGTALGLKDSSGTYGFETDMGTLRSTLTPDGKSWSPLPGAFYFGGGGGTSEDFAQPWYQQHVVPTALTHTLMTGQHSTTAQRVTPDVAMNGDLYTSVLVGMSDGAPYTEGGYGGTSVAAPEFSAVQADAIQAHHGKPIGFANPALYLHAGTKAFTDVVDQAAAHNQAPLNAVSDFGVIGGSLHARLVAFGEDTSLNAVKGYDNATGVGSPTLAYLDSFR